LGLLAHQTYGRWPKRGPTALVSYFNRPRQPADGVLSQIEFFIEFFDGWVVHYFHRYWEWG